MERVRRRAILSDPNPSWLSLTVIVYKKQKQKQNRRAVCAEAKRIKAIGIVNYLEIKFQAGIFLVGRMKSGKNFFQNFATNTKKHCSRST